MTPYSAYPLPHLPDAQGDVAGGLARGEVDGSKGALFVLGCGRDVEGVVGGRVDGDPAVFVGLFGAGAVESIGL